MSRDQEDKNKETFDVEAFLASQKEQNILLRETVKRIQKQIVDDCRISCAWEKHIDEQFAAWKKEFLERNENLNNEFVNREFVFWCNYYDAMRRRKGIWGKVARQWFEERKPKENDK